MYTKSNKNYSNQSQGTSYQGPQGQYRPKGGPGPNQKKRYNQDFDSENRNSE